ncbi:protein-glutamate methylesterase/protein-glutamine glutaminase [Isachenkonia alkalipeptolytica]|uniref:Protein-glutamate methylesterase/protein-glutamine glutaminase n=1 Tax=Isachenkonia alkalipeptolytica TaxID=2565777 RepID=A0AA43XIU9_9CLOT|nr:chemotaxis response regulator protein-glutamate methylesterase [Isachenkonia alkalipeptolytica]NBG87588.1 chemotaxis response regulator protein-glutamate methylesterase [Isachenkonia alkalipeptolytica]
MENTIKVLIVDDSAFIRQIIRDILSRDPIFEVVDYARNGKDAIEKVQRHRPDVVTMDVEMPILNGIEALEIIMEKHPAPVVMFSSLTAQGTEATMKALEYGAVDVAKKPSHQDLKDLSELSQEIIQKLKTAAGVKNIQKPQRVQSEKDLKIIRKSLVDISQSPKEKGFLDPRSETPRIVAIGTSTGGPRALQRVIPLIPKNTKASFVIVQHMPPGFTKSLAERLNTLSEITVKEAVQGEVLQPGHGYIAKGGAHLRLKKNSRGQLFLDLGEDPPIAGHRPSVNALFQSLRQENIQDVISVIMTGMGSDGAKGIQELKKATKNHVIAQNEESSVVYGMPKTVVEQGDADEVADLDEITKKVLKHLEVQK